MAFGGLVKIELNSDAVKALLQSDEIAAELERRGQAIAQAAGSGFAMDSEVGPNRARVSVHSINAEGAVAEARDQALTRAIDAGR